MKRATTLIALAAALISGGCGLVSVLGTPSGTEEAIKAKYDISQKYNEKIVVLVNQPHWVDSPLNMQKEITDKINAYFRVHFKKMPETSIINYETIKEARAGNVDLTTMSPIEIGQKFDAGLILYVEIIDFSFSQLSAGTYYSAEMKTSSALYDGRTGEVLWPQQKGESIVSLVVEAEKGVPQTVARLATANAHCILRNFYDCKRVKYRIVDEQKQFDAEQW